MYASLPSLRLPGTDLVDLFFLLILGWSGTKNKPAEFKQAVSSCRWPLTPPPARLKGAGTQMETRTRLAGFLHTSTPREAVLRVSAVLICTKGLEDALEILVFRSRWKQEGTWFCYQQRDRQTDIHTSVHLGDDGESDCESCHVMLLNRSVFTERRTS